MDSMWIVVMILAVFAVARLMSKRQRKSRPRNSADRKPRFESLKTGWSPSPDKLNEMIAEGLSASKATAPDAQYRDKFQLLNRSEQTLYWRLKEAAPALIIFSQVSMSQVFHINERTPGRQAKLNEIGKKTLDFLVCRSEDTSIVAAIELNGPIHDTEKQRLIDETKRRTLEQAGIPLIVVKPDNVPKVAELRKLLAPYIVERRKYEAERNTRLQRAGG